MHFWTIFLYEQQLFRKDSLTLKRIVLIPHQSSGRLGPPLPHRRDRPPTPPLHRSLPPPPLSSSKSPFLMKPLALFGKFGLVWFGLALHCSTVGLRLTSLRPPPSYIGGSDLGTHLYTLHSSPVGGVGTHGLYSTILY